MFFNQNVGRRLLDLEELCGFFFLMGRKIPISNIVRMGKAPIGPPPPHIKCRQVLLFPPPAIRGKRYTLQELRLVGNKENATIWRLASPTL